MRIKLLNEDFGQENYNENVDDMMKDLSTSLQDESFRFQFLDRLKTDCDYFLSYGMAYEPQLWAKRVDDQIELMKRVYALIPEDDKPDWLTMEDIINYENRMKERARRRYETMENKKVLKEGTSNFHSMADLPLYIFGDYDSVLDKYYAQALEMCEDPDDAAEKADELMSNDVDYCLLTDEDSDRLEDDIDNFNRECKNSDDYDPYEMSEVKVELKPGYYEAYQLYCDTDSIGDIQLEKVKKFFEEMKKKYNLTSLGVAYRFSNGETGYNIIKECDTKSALKLSEDLEDDDNFDSEEDMTKLIKEGIDNETREILKRCSDDDLCDISFDKDGDLFLIVEDDNAVAEISKALGYTPKSEFDSSAIDKLCNWGYSDDYCTCDECGRAIRTEADSYSWVADYYVDEMYSQYVCGNCVREDPESYIRYLINDASRANTILDDETLEDYDFKKLNDDYQNGFYGRNDDPSTILDKLLDKYEGEFIFSVISAGQFATDFSVWGRNMKPIEEEEEVTATETEE